MAILFFGQALGLFRRIADVDQRLGQVLRGIAEPHTHPAAKQYDFHFLSR